MSFFQLVGIVVRELFPDFDVSQCFNPDAPSINDCVAIRVARVIDPPRFVAINGRVDDHCIVNREEHEEWDYATAAITGSSYLRLNPFLRWFTGSIGLHHVHHLGPKIPNYRLQRAHDENRIFEKAPVMTFGMGFRALRLALYDEDARRLIRFKDVPVSERKNLAA